MIEIFTAKKKKSLYVTCCVMNLKKEVNLQKQPFIVSSEEAGSLEKHACGDIYAKLYYAAQHTKRFQFYPKQIKLNLATFYYDGCCTHCGTSEFKCHVSDAKRSTHHR